MSTLERVAPIFAVRDLDTSMAHYRQMGFATRSYEGGGYGFATRDGIEVHLGVVPATDPRTSAAYFFVDDADRLAEEWRAAGLHVHEPEDTEWGSTRARSWTPTAMSSGSARRRHPLWYVPHTGRSGTG